MSDVFFCVFILICTWLGLNLRRFSMRFTASLEAASPRVSTSGLRFMVAALSRMVAAYSEQISYWEGCELDMCMYMYMYGIAIYPSVRLFDTCSANKCLEQNPYSWCPSCCGFSPDIRPRLITEYGFYCLCNIFGVRMFSSALSQGNK